MNIRRGMHQTAALLAGSAVVLSLAACSGEAAEPGDNSSSAAPIELTIAEQGTAAASTGLYPHLADELGFFKDEGIVIKDYVSVTAGGDAITGMISGDVQISHIGPEGITASSKGADVIGIAAAFDATIWPVIAQEGTASFADLKGKTIALGSLSDITRVVFDELASSAGLDPAKDLNYVVAGATPNRVAAVQNGQAAATIATYPSAAALTNAVNLGLAPTGTKAPSIIAAEIEASGSWARANPDAVVRYLRAIAKAVAYVKDPANQDKVAPMIAKLENASEDSVRTMLEEYFYNPPVAGAYFPDDFHHIPGVFDSTVQSYLDLGIITTKVSEDDYMDYSFIDEALKSLN